MAHIPSERRELAIQTPTLHGAAHHEVMASPAMVRARTIGEHAAAEVRGGEQRHLIFHAQDLHLPHEMFQGLVDLHEQPVLGGLLAAMGVEAAQADEEHLAAHTQALPAGDDARHHPQLLDERVGAAATTDAGHGQQA